MAWLKEYLESQAKLLDKKFENIHDKNQKFQTFLMRSPTIESTNKTSKASQSNVNVDQQRPEIPEKLKYYRRKQELQNCTTGVDFYPRKHHSPNKQGETEERRSKDIHGSVLSPSPNTWLAVDRTSTYENITTHRNDSMLATNTNTNTNTNTAFATNTQTKLTSAHLSSINTTNDDELPIKLSITERGFKEHKERLKLLRNSKEGRISNPILRNKNSPRLRGNEGKQSETDGFSLENRSKADSPSREVTNNTISGRAFRNVYHTKSSQSASKLEQVLQMQSDQQLMPNISLSLRLHEIYPCLSENSNIAKMLSPHKSSRLLIRSDSETKRQEELQLKARKEMNSRLAELDSHGDIREKINQDLFMFSKRNAQGFSGTLYNKTFVTAMISTPTERAESPINLRLRERLNQIKKISAAKNETAIAEPLAETERTLNATEGPNSALHSESRAQRNKSQLDSIQTQSSNSKIAHIEPPNKFRITNASPRELRPMVHNAAISRMIKIHSDPGANIKITDRFDTEQNNTSQGEIEVLQTKRLLTTN